MIYNSVIYIWCVAVAVIKLRFDPHPKPKPKKQKSKNDGAIFGFLFLGFLVIHCDASTAILSIMVLGSSAMVPMTESS